MALKAKVILIVIFVISVLMLGFSMCLDTFCSFSISDDWFRGKQAQICEISYQVIEKINS
jgi:hypothetical protein